MKNEKSIVIRINEKYRIKIIPDNFILQKKKITHKKETKWVSEGYFSTIGQLYDEYIETAPMRLQTRSGSFKKMVLSVKSAKREIMQAIKNN